jgi:sulfur-oxidizing protein SoxA
MKRQWVLVSSFAAMLVASVGALASPADDRRHLAELYQKLFPDVKPQDYVYGALIFSPDAKQQYESMMEMPPWSATIDKGKSMWETPFKNGKTYAHCFPDGGKNVAGNYPYFDARLHKVVTFEMALNRCRAANGEAEYKYDDMGTMGTLEAYARSLSDGMPMNVKVEGKAALAAYNKGRSLYYKRMGQLNFACANCHVGAVGKHVRNEFLSPAIGQATHWPVFRGEGTLFTLQKRYAACQGMVRAAPLALGGEEYNDLEYYHSYISNGLPIQAAVWRK